MFQRGPGNGAGQVTFSCDGKQDGFYADYVRECRQYYRCLKGEMDTYHCPAGLQFDEEMRACILPEDVQCPQVRRQFEVNNNNNKIFI